MACPDRTHENSILRNLAILFDFSGSIPRETVQRAADAVILSSMWKKDHAYELFYQPGRDGRGPSLSILDIFTGPSSLGFQNQYRGNHTR